MFCNFIYLIISSYQILIVDQDKGSNRYKGEILHCLLQSVARCVDFEKEKRENLYFKPCPINNLLMCSLEL